MFNINLYFVNAKDTTSRFFIELIHDSEELPSTFYFELVVDFIQNKDGERQLRITSVKEIYDIISFIYKYYGEQDIIKYLVGIENKKRILSSLDKLEVKYASGEIDSSKIDFSEDLEKLLKIYKEPSKKTNNNIYKENNKFIREYLSLKNKDKDLPSYDR